MDISGKLPPHNLEAEKAVIGAILGFKNAISKVDTILRPESFYKTSYGIIYQAAFNLYEKGTTIDLVTMIDELNRMNKLSEAGGDYEITTLTYNIATDVHIVEHAAIVHELYLKREIIKYAHETMNHGFDGSETAEQTISHFNHAAEMLNEISTGIYNDNSLRSVLKRCMNDLELRTMNQKNDISNGITTGLKKLDAAIDGWKGGELIVIGARPGMGKTAFLIKEAKEAAKAGKSVMIFELEMTETSLANRMIIGESGVDSDAFKRGQLEQKDWPYIEQANDKLSKLPIYIDTKPGITHSYIKSIARKYHKKNKCDIIFIDYLGLMKSSIRTIDKNTIIEDITTNLKQLAKELNIPVVLLSQLNRKVEERPNKEPMLADLRDSGSIEQDADIVMFLFRPDYYGITGKNGQSLAGQIKINIAKFRDGKTQNVYLHHNQSLTEFYDEEPNAF